MKQTAIGVLLATLGMYAWGFVFWGMSDLGYSSWKEADHAGARKALLDNFPESGTYFVPSLRHPPEVCAKLLEEGPIAFVHLNREGRPAMDPTIMIEGFILYAVVAFLLAAVLHAADRPSYVARLRLMAIVGLLAVVALHVGDAVWWQIPWGWKMTQFAYDLVALTIGGAILARFVRPEPAA